MKINNFSDWWEINQKEYEKIGINKIVAKTIWNAAIDTVEINIDKILEKLQ